MQTRPRVPMPLVRLLWFAAYWLAGVAAVGAVAIAIRIMLKR